MLTLLYIYAFLALVLFLFISFLNKKGPNSIFKEEREYDKWEKSFGKCGELTDKCFKFFKIDDNTRVYKSEWEEFQKIIFSDFKSPRTKNGQFDFKFETNRNIEKAEKIKKTFKHILPELIQEERENKLNQILSD